MAGSVHPCFCPCPFFVLCFVFSGPRLHPWQKESRNLTKVSPPPHAHPCTRMGGGPLIPQGMGGKAQFLRRSVGVWVGKGHRNLGI